MRSYAMLCKLEEDKTKDHQLKFEVFKFGMHEHVTDNYKY